MAEVDVVINGRSHKLACADGQEAHVSALAARIDAHASSVGRGSVGPAAEGKVILMAGLMIADELHEAEQRLQELKSELSDMKIKLAAGRAQGGADAGRAEAGRADAAKIEEIEQMMVSLLNQAAEQMEDLAGRLRGE